MADTKKVIRMLNNTLRHCHNLYNHVTSEEQTWLAEINQGAKEALELLKKQEAEPPIVHTLLGVNYYYCPGCARPIIKSVAEEQPRYCKDCGKGLKWYG